MCVISGRFCTIMIFAEVTRRGQFGRPRRPAAVGGCSPTLQGAALQSTTHTPARMVTCWNVTNMPAFEHATLGTLRCRASHLVPLLYYCHYCPYILYKAVTRMRASCPRGGSSAEALEDASPTYITCESNTRRFREGHLTQVSGRSTHPWNSNRELGRSCRPEGF